MKLKKKNKASKNKNKKNIKLYATHKNTKLINKIRKQITNETNNTSPSI